VWRSSEDIRANCGLGADQTSADPLGGPDFTDDPRGAPARPLCRPDLADERARPTAHAERVSKVLHTAYCDAHTRPTDRALMSRVRTLPPTGLVRPHMPMSGCLAVPVSGLELISG